MPVLIQYIFTFFGFLFAIAYGVGMWRNGKNQEKIDTITILSSDVQTLRAKVEELTAQVKSLKEENEIEKKKFVDAILLLQGKDTGMVEFIKNQNEFMTYTKLILVRVDKYLNHKSF